LQAIDCTGTYNQKPDSLRLFSQRRSRTPNIAVPELLTAAVNAPASWECGATWRM